LTLKIADLDGAKDVKAKDKALKEMTYLLNDNVEVITAPPAPPV
jgi:phosphoribosylformimino-5-aminoimidazole carboxamide ribonucleotide (ProFAR) isomerase